jgi:hypothetical protein
MYEVPNARLRLFGGEGPEIGSAEVATTDSLGADDPRADLGARQLGDFVSVSGNAAALVRVTSWCGGSRASAGVPTATAVRDRLLCGRYAVEHQPVRNTLDESDPGVLKRVQYYDGQNGMPVLGRQRLLGGVPVDRS